METINRPIGRHFYRCGVKKKKETPPPEFKNWRPAETFLEKKSEGGDVYLKKRVIHRGQMAVNIFQRKKKLSAPWTVRQVTQVHCCHFLQQRIKFHSSRHSSKISDKVKQVKRWRWTEMKALGCCPFSTEMLNKQKSTKVQYLPVRGLKKMTLVHSNSKLIETSKCQTEMNQLQVINEFQQAKKKKRMKFRRS